MTIKYPDVAVDLEGVNGNAMSIMAAVSKGIRAVHGEQAAVEYRAEALKSPSYDALIQHAMSTVDVGYGNELEA